MMILSLTFQFPLVEPDCKVVCTHSSIFYKRKILCNINQRQQERVVCHEELYQYLVRDPWLDNTVLESMHGTYERKKGFPIRRKWREGWLTYVWQNYPNAQCQEVDTVQYLICWSNLIRILLTRTNAHVHAMLLIRWCMYTHHQPYHYLITESAPGCHMYKLPPWTSRSSR
jgi:hypothetical protein